MPRAIKRPVLLLRPALLSVALTSLILVLLTPVWVVGALFGPCLLPHPTSFIEILWQIDDGSSTCSFRYPMVEDLRSRRLKPGMTKQDVRGLLGEPPDPAYSRYGSDDRLVYTVGCWIDCNWLVIEFDAEDRLIETFAYQD